MTPPETSGVFSYFGGSWFTFSDQGRQIVAGGSSLTGRERVFVDGALVSEHRNFRRQNAHDFTAGEHRYRVTFDLASGQRGEIRCTLERDGVQAGDLLGNWYSRHQLSTWQVAALAVVLTAAAAWVSETYDASYWPLGVAAVVMAVAYYGYPLLGAKFIVEPLP